MINIMDHFMIASSSTNYFGSRAIFTRFEHNPQFDLRERSRSRKTSPSFVEMSETSYGQKYVFLLSIRNEQYKNQDDSKKIDLNGSVLITNNAYLRRSK